MTYFVFQYNQYILCTFTANIYDMTVILNYKSYYVLLIIVIIEMAYLCIKNCVNIYFNYIKPVIAGTVYFNSNLAHNK